MSVDNRNSSTYKQYVKNKREIFIKVIILLVLSYLVLYVVLKIFSLYLEPEIFLFVFLGLMIAWAGYDKYVNKWGDRKWFANYRTWGRGAGAELESKKCLAELGAEYKVISDFQSGRGNIDYICVGPTGIFVIETKSHKGIISWGGEILRNGQPLEKDIIKQVHGQIYYLRNLLKEKFGTDYFIQGVIEFTNAKVNIRRPVNGIYIGGRKFPGWVIRNKFKQSLSPAEVDEIDKYLKEVGVY
jgi:hypothetical protein